MSLRYFLWLPVLLSMVQVGIGDGFVKSKTPPGRAARQTKAITVPYCDLVNNEARYTGKLVRVKATVLTWLDGTTLYDPECGSQGLEPVLDCKDKEACSAMRKAMETKMDYDGDVGRVKAVLIGRLVVPPNTPGGKPRAKFMIQTIEQATPISREVPWPGKQQ